MNSKATAQDWIDADRAAIRADILRLGPGRAITYQMDLISDRIMSGDTRWDGITRDDMRRAMRAMRQS